jgi:formylglycine-generating enzyme required for sulfatase activity
MGRDNISGFRCAAADDAPEKKEKSVEIPLRGGSWSDDDRYLRAANSVGFDPMFIRDVIGFRCAAAEAETIHAQ